VGLSFCPETAPLTDLRCQDSCDRNKVGCFIKLEHTGLASRPSGNSHPHLCKVIHVSEALRLTLRQHKCKSPFWIRLCYCEILSALLGSAKFPPVIIRPPLNRPLTYGSDGSVWGWGEGSRFFIWLKQAPFTRHLLHSHNRIVE